jgi:hypothetical protein
MIFSNFGFFVEKSRRPNPRRLNAKAQREDAKGRGDVMTRGWDFGWGGEEASVLSRVLLIVCFLMALRHFASSLCAFAFNSFF